MTALNHYRLLGRSALRVSPLCLGTMTFGTEWGWGEDKETSRKVFDRYVELGGNFFDTANRYTEGTSETFLGEFIKGRREQFVVATKYTLFMREGDPNSAGNHRKNMVQSVEASLKRLQTDYVDLYWVHAWDGLTAIEEVMRALDDLVRAGKILHAGISDAPAWKVSQANTLAELRGWTPFTALQVKYSLVDRALERDLLPMAREFGIAVTPWGVLASGVLSGKFNERKSSQGSRVEVTGNAFGALNDRNLAIAAEVEKVAKEIGCTSAQVAYAWMLEQPGITSPIIGARTVPQLNDILGSLTIKLSEPHRERLDNVTKPELGFPHDFLASDGVRRLTTGGAIIEH